MHAVVINDEKLEMTERPTPDPGPYDVVVAVRAAGINAADLLQRQGFYPPPPGWPVDVPGMELAGVVSAVGERVNEPLLGRRVCALVGGGAQATHCVVPSGDRVLISGAAGGVGSAGVQIAHAFGCHVTAVTRTSEHHERLRTFGADETITLDQVSTIQPVNVVLELVGASHFSLAQHVLAPFARVVVIGVSGGGSRVEVDLLTIMRVRATLSGSTLRSRSREEKAEVVGLVNQSLVPLWTTEELKVPVAKTFPLANAEEAYEFFSRPGKFGKIILRVDE
jgi:NADPH2:quinone reductase